MTDQLEGQMSIFDLDLQFTKTFLEHSQATAAETSRPSSRKSSGSQRRNVPMCLCLTEEHGQNADACTMRWEGGALLGEYTMRSFGEQPSMLMAECSFPELPNGVSVSRLSQILEDSAHQRFFLSERACRGILSRAARRGKELPEILKKALTDQISRGNGNP